MIDTGYLVYEMMSSWFVKKVGLEYISIFIKKLIGIGGKKGKISKIIKVEIDIDEYL